jgi:hypothetical protein
MQFPVACISYYPIDTPALPLAGLTFSICYRVPAATENGKTAKTARISLFSNGYCFKFESAVVDGLFAERHFSPREFDIR